MSVPPEPATEGMEWVFSLMPRLENLRQDGGRGHRLTIRPPHESWVQLAGSGLHGHIVQLRAGLCVFRDRWAGGTLGSAIRNVLAASPVSLRQDVPFMLLCGIWGPSETFSSAHGSPVAWATCPWSGHRSSDKK